MEDLVRKTKINGMHCNIIINWIWFGILWVNKYDLISSTILWISRFWIVVFYKKKKKVIQYQYFILWMGLYYIKYYYINIDKFWSMLKFLLINIVVWVFYKHVLEDGFIMSYVIWVFYQPFAKYITFLIELKNDNIKY